MKETCKLLETFSILEEQVCGIATAALATPITRLVTRGASVEAAKVAIPF